MPQGLQRWAIQCITHRGKRFNSLVGVVIFSNTFMMGLEVDLNRETEETPDAEKLDVWWSARIYSAQGHSQGNVNPKFLKLNPHLPRKCVSNKAK